VRVCVNRLWKASIEGTTAFENTTLFSAHMQPCSVYTYGIPLTLTTRRPNYLLSIYVARACSSMFYVTISATNTETGESIISKRLLTLNITSTKDVDTSVTTNSPSKDILP